MGLLLVNANHGTGGRIVAETLARLGARTIFSVSGNQILPIYDALPDAGLRLIHMRQESAAAYAASAHAELTGPPGVALVSAGPGFLASLTGVAVARSMEVPLLLLSGAAPSTRRGQGAFQDLDQAAAASVACKAALDVASPQQIASVIAAAWELARDEVPGPVHVGLPSDILLATVDLQAAAPPTVAAPQPGNGSRTSALRDMAARLREANRPAIVVRPSAARGEAGAALERLSRTLGVAPIVTGSPRGLSDLKYAEAIGALPDADVTLVVAPADFAVGFLDAGLMRGDVLLIDAPGDPEPTRAPALRCVLPPTEALPLLSGLVSTSLADPHWRATMARRAPLPAAPDDGGLHPLIVAAAVREVLRPGDVLALDGGEFCQWVRLGLRDIPNLMLWNGKLGAIGGSLPQAIGLAAGGRAGMGRVIAIQGDGAAGYHLSEFETCAREGLAVTVIVGNDARWSAEWHQQVSRYGPERTFSTELLPARYDLAAAGFGAEGIDVPDAATLRDALERALASDRPTCLNAHVRSVASPAVIH